ncbi:hypothetical protein niasHT_001938 [Heterodera trifolii]|uniref:Uncharacterized protein n=1 Tax=Heterodera trifolii TaxID=157864 RepID=A0ABD2LV69_9BILA
MGAKKNWEDFWVATTEETEGGLRTPTTIGGTTMAFPPSARDYFVISSSNTAKRRRTSSSERDMARGGGTPPSPEGVGRGQATGPSLPPGNIATTTATATTVDGGGMELRPRLSQAKPRPKNDAIDQTVIERRREFKQQQQQS